MASTGAQQNSDGKTGKEERHAGGAEKLVKTGPESKRQEILDPSPPAPIITNSETGGQAPKALGSLPFKGEVMSSSPRQVPEHHRV